MELKPGLKHSETPGTPSPPNDKPLKRMTETTTPQMADKDRALSQ